MVKHFFIAMLGTVLFSTTTVSAQTMKEAYFYGEKAGKSLKTPFTGIFQHGRRKILRLYLGLTAGSGLEMAMTRACVCAKSCVSCVMLKSILNNNIDCITGK